MAREEQATADAAGWLARLQRPDITEQDGLEFDAWLAAAPQNAPAYRHALSLWHELEAGADDILAELDAAARRPARGLRGRSARRWLAGAGGFAVAAGLALAIMPSFTAGPAAVQAYATGKGQHQRIALGDGSTVDLDAETRLSVSFSKSERRIILADGQAIFDVAHDAHRPFTVQAGDRLIRDIGTQFDVRRRADALTVTVARGRVEVRPVSAEAGGRAFRLDPGQRLEIDRTSAGQLSTVDPQETFSWRSGRLVYRAQPLADVVADLNRQFVEQTEIADPELGKTPITGVIVLDNPRDVMARLSLMLPIKAVPSERGLKLLRK
ncbi:MAG: FecR family protein [Phenylobacterium sp.]